MLSETIQGTSVSNRAEDSLLYLLASHFYHYHPWDPSPYPMRILSGWCLLFDAKHTSRPPRDPLSQVLRAPMIDRGSQEDSPVRTGLVSTCICRSSRRRLLVRSKHQIQIEVVTGYQLTLFISFVCGLCLFLGGYITHLPPANLLFTSYVPSYCISICIYLLKCFFKKVYSNIDHLLGRICKLAFWIMHEDLYIYTHRWLKQNKIWNWKCDSGTSISEWWA